MNWKVGDWAIFELSIVQIKRLDWPHGEVSDGSFSTSGMIGERLRPLTLRGKAIIEYIDFFYCELNKISGHGGFNYPDIFRHYCQLALEAIDNEDIKPIYDKVRDFVTQAREHKPIIQGVSLFRPAA